MHKGVSIRDWMRAGCPKNGINYLVARTLREAQRAPGSFAKKTKSRRLYELHFTDGRVVPVVIQLTAPRHPTRVKQKRKPKINTGEYIKSFRERKLRVVESMTKPKQTTGRKSPSRYWKRDLNDAFITKDHRVPGE